jgi:DnaJ-class molecular chaperone
MKANTKDQVKTYEERAESYEYEEFIICPHCGGSGVFKLDGNGCINTKLEGKLNELSTNDICSKCDGVGKLIKTTKVKVKKSES